MDEPGPGVDLLRDPQVKAYFLHLLECPLSDEMKYQKFMEYCMQQVSPAVLAAASNDSFSSRSAGADTVRMDELLPRIVDCIRHAVLRMQRSQHQDGGWGLQIEQSNFWHTVYVLLFLKSAQELLDRECAAELEVMLRKGAAYLEQHPESWAPDMLPGVGGISVYDVSLMVRYFYRVGRQFLRREAALRVYRGLDRLYHAQNEDGGWDASLWGYEVGTPVRVWSEVGATSEALQALAETHDARFQAAMAKGMQWLAGTQNPDGSWNDGSCEARLPGFRLTGESSVIKTCDAVHGFLAGEALDLALQPYRGCITRAVDWLLRQERPVLERQRWISRWGWGYTAADYENTGLLLELLLRLPDISPDSLAPYAAWLVQSQRRQADDPEDGCWVLGHTARIGLVLAEFSRRVNEKGGKQQVPWMG